ncbi:MAG: AbiV family abortive infection protein [Syntrophales bacterium]|nr:AbiV family abortive infection protein [Syntrophales bacterium]
MSKKTLNQYRGHLTPENIVKGMKAANDNAKRLYEDAKLLLDNSRYASATSLAILSIEESGKISILREMALITNGKGLNKIWRRYRSHTEKNIAWILPDLVLKGARCMSDLREIFDANSDHPQILDQIKQISFYSDCLGECKWSIPNDIIKKSIADSLVKTAGIFISKEITSTKEIELWTKHLGPIWKEVTEGLQRKDIDILQKAVENFEQEMSELGLKLDEDNKLSDFIKYQKDK